MRPRLPAIARFALVTLVGGACRSPNPSFLDDLEDTGTAAATESSAEPKDPATPAQDQSTQAETSTTPSTGTTPDPSPDPPSTDIGPWDRDSPEPQKDVTAKEHCQWGAKACFVFDDPQAKLIVSQGSGLPRIEAKLHNVQKPAPVATKVFAPLTDGVAFDGISSWVEPTANYPRFAGQELGIEIWYRSQVVGPNAIVRQRMLFQAPSPIWIAENPANGKVYCAFPAFHADKGWRPTLMRNEYQPTPTADGTGSLRYVACFIKDEVAYLYSNGHLQFQNIDTSGNRFFFDKDILDQGFAIGRWVEGNSAHEHFDPFLGTMYMVRVWNNIDYMRKAMLAEINEQGLTPGAFAKELPDLSVP